MWWVRTVLASSSCLSFRDIRLMVGPQRSCIAPSSFLFYCFVGFDFYTVLYEAMRSETQVGLISKTNRGRAMSTLRQLPKVLEILICHSHILTAKGMLLHYLQCKLKTKRLEHISQLFSVLTMWFGEIT
jgi:hypothetical protein